MDWKEFAGPIALLLFIVAVLLFTCLCILCKRKKRKTQDVNRILAATAQLSRQRSCAGVSADDHERAAESARSMEVRVNDMQSAAVTPNTVVGQVNIAFEVDTAGLPPDYQEALKSKYAKVYPHIYPSLERFSSSLDSSASSSVSPASHPHPANEEIIRSRCTIDESPPPPYDIAVRYDDASGHF